MTEESDPISEIENNIQIILSYPGYYTKEGKTAAQSEMNSMTTSSIGIGFFIEHFKVFRKDTSYRFFFNYIGHWFSYFWDEIDEGIIEMLPEFLFTTAISEFSKFGVGSKAELGMAQSLFIIKFFENWQNFFDETFFNPLQIDVALNFFTQFTRMFGSVRKSEIPKYIQFKNEVVSQIADKIKEIILQGISESRAESFDVLSNYTQFIDPSWALEDEMLQHIAVSMESENLLPAVFRSIQGILLSTADIDQKKQIIEQFNIIDILTSIDTENESILLELTKLLCLMGQIPTLVGDDPSEFINIACLYLTKSDPVSTCAGSFILNFIKKSPDTSANVMQSTLTKLYSFNAEHPTLEETPCQKILLRLIGTCLTINPDDSVDVFIELLGDASSHSDEIEYFSTISQFIKIQRDVGAHLEETNELLTGVIYPMVQSISNVDETQYRMVYSLFNALIPLKSSNTEIVTAFSLAALEFILNDDTPDILRTSVADWLVTTLEKDSTCFDQEQIDILIIHQLLSSNILSFSRVAAALLFPFQLGATRDSCFNSCIDLLTELIGQADLPTSRSLSLCSLYFLLEYANKYIKERFPINGCAEFIQSIFTAFPYDPQIQSLILCLCPYIGNEGIDLFNSIIPYVNSTTGTDGIARGVLAFLSIIGKYDQEHQGQYKSEEWQTEMFDQIFEKVTTFIKQIYTTIPVCISSSDESMVRSFFTLLGYIWPRISEERFGAAIEFTIDFLDHYYDVPQMFKYVFSFISKFSESQNSKPNLSNLIGSLLQFILAPTFDPGQPKWAEFVACIANPLGKLINTYYNPMTVAAANFFSGIQYPDELYSEFIQTTESGGEKYKVMCQTLNYTVTYRSAAFF